MSTHLRLIIALLALCAAGCAATDRDDEFIYGDWQGEGRYAQCEVADDGLQTESGTYPARLSICRDTYEEQDAIGIEIVSESGVLSKPDAPEPNVHIRAWLLRPQQLADGETLYDVVAHLIDANGKESTLSKGSHPSASLFPQGATSTLIIEYAEDFADVFCFEDDMVRKVGRYRSDKHFIHWAECLHEVDD